MSTSDSGIDPRALRNAFGTFLTGVTVVTTRDVEGKPLGFTANSFTSVSLDPPLVLACLANRSYNFAAFAEAPGFAVNVLSEGQVEVSNTFARPVEDRFAAVDWSLGPHGSPILGNVSAWFDCSMHDRIEAGDHLVLIGKVEAFDASPAPGLGYARGAYVTAAVERAALDQRSSRIVTALIANSDGVLLLDDGSGQLTLPHVEVGKDGTSATLSHLIGDSGVAAEPGFIYALYEDDARDVQHVSFLCHAAEGTPSQGAFMALADETLSRIADPAYRMMLERFATESRVGSFSQYHGSKTDGEILSMRSERTGVDPV